MPRKRFTAAAKRHYSLRANPVRAAVAAAAAARAQAATAAPPVSAAAPVVLQLLDLLQEKGEEDLEDKFQL